MDERIRMLNNMNDENVRRVADYMAENEKAWPQDISLALKIEFGEVMAITKYLLDEGLLGFVNGDRVDEKWD